MFCSICGAEVQPGLKFCPACGAEQPSHPAQPQNPTAQLGESPLCLTYGTASGPRGEWIPPAVLTVRTGEWVSGGWKLMEGFVGTCMLMALVMVLVNSVVPVVLAGLMTAGFHYAFVKRMRNGSLEVGDLFKPMSRFVPVLVAHLLIAFLTFIAFLFCFIPGLVVMAMYMFTFLFIVDKKMDFWPAMTASHEIVKRDYFGFTIFITALALLNFAGLLCCGVGLLVTIPLSYAAVTVAYKEIVGFEPNIEI